LSSIRSQDVPVEIIVVDNHSSDSTPTIAASLADRVIVAGPERSRQRNLGAAASRCRVLAFIDSDMKLGIGVSRTALAAIHDGAAAVVIPERTVGKSFTARVRAFERGFYAEGSSVEAARVFRRDIFEQVGGYDEGLTGSEDWDLHMRVAAGHSVSRANATIYHDESGISFVAACRKKAAYARGMQLFLKKHGAGAASVAMDRPWLRRPWRLAYPYPVLGLGLLALKTGEVAAVLVALAADALVPRWLRGRPTGRRRAGGAAAPPSGLPRYALNPNPGTHATVVLAVPVRSRVLDVGCATGYIGKLLAARGCTVTGIECDTDAAAAARDTGAYAEIVHMDVGESAHDLPRGPFDVVLCADVLEHIIDPVSVIRRLAVLLAPGGRMIISVPNIANVAVRIALLAGRFEYTDAGILDRTHLRFFTHRTAAGLVRDGGLHIQEVLSGSDRFGWILNRHVRAAHALRGLLAYNIIIVAVPEASNDELSIPDAHLRIEGGRSDPEGSEH